MTWVCCTRLAYATYSPSISTLRCKCPVQLEASTIKMQERLTRSIGSSPPQIPCKSTRTRPLRKRRRYLRQPRPRYRMPQVHRRTYILVHFQVSRYESKG